MKAILKLGFPLIVLLLAGCVHVDPETGKTIPQGNQRNMFADVERLAEQLKNGMTKWQVMILLGSPAEMSEESNVWVYLPERPLARGADRFTDLEHAWVCSGRRS